MAGFKISTSPKFWADVPMQMKAEDGRDLKGSIKVLFSRLGKSAFEEFNERQKDADVSVALLEVVHDWKGPEDDEGAVTFSPENFKRWCDAVPGSYSAIATRFAKIHRGTELMAEVRAGN